MNFLVQMRRFYRASVIGLVILLVITLLFGGAHLLISRTQAQLSDLQSHLYRETRLIIGLQEKFSFFIKYNRERDKFQSLWRNIVDDIRPAIRELEQNGDTRNALVTALDRNFIISRFTDFRTDLLKVNDGELRLREWAAEGLRLIQNGDNIQIADLGPLESGLIGRGVWIDNAENAFENLSKTRSQIEIVQRKNFLAFIAVIFALLFVLIRYFLYPAMRGALRARQLEREEMTLRHALMLLPQALQESFDTRQQDWQTFFDGAATRISVRQDKFWVTFSCERGNPDDFLGDAGRVQACSQTQRHGLLVTTLSFPEQWSTQRDVLQRMTERLHAIMIDARHRRVADALEADRDKYFAFLRASLDNLPVATCFFNTNDELVFHNDEFSKTIGAFGLTVTGETVLDDCVSALSSQNTRAAILLRDMFATRESSQFQCEIGQTTYHWQCNQVEGHGALFCARDITAEIAQAEARYNEKRLESLGTLSGGVSHDVNNFLSIIMNNIELARGQIDAEMRAECIDEAIQACLDAGRINKQLLSYARKQPLAPKAVDPGELIAACEKYAAQWQRGADLTVRQSAQNWFWADEAGLKSATINLLKNALEATAAGQDILLDICDAVTSGGAALRLTLSDSGPGFSSADPGRCLEPFYSTKATGSGLGLSAVEGFVKQSSGQLIIKNRQEGNGAEISFILPAVPRGRKASTESRRESTSETSHKNILIVDDNIQMLRTMEIALNTPSFDITRADTVTSAIELIDAADGVSFDLLVTDLILPDGTGFDIARRFRSKFPKAKILYISGFPSEHFQEDIREIPAEFLAKPFPIDMLKKHVRDLLHPSWDFHLA